MSRLIDADAFDERVRVAGGMSEEELTEDFKDGVQAVLYMLSNQPTIQLEPHWIPVTENCDCDLMDNEEVLVFQKDGTINGQIRHAMFYDFNGKKKFVTWEEGITIYDVVAYMPLPEPYKGVTDGND